MTEKCLSQSRANVNPPALAGLLGGKDKLVGSLGKADADPGLGVAVDIIEHSLQGGVLVILTNGDAVDSKLLETLSVLVQTVIVFVNSVAFVVHIRNVTIRVLYLMRLANAFGPTVTSA